MRSTPKAHQLAGAHQLEPWRVHALASDFQLLDVWQFPVRIHDSVPLQTFLDFLAISQAELMQGRGAAASLFRLRATAGRWFGWDAPGVARAIPGGTRSSLRDRLEPDESHVGSSNEGDAAALASFSPVYRLENEALLEISNATVHALLHLGRVEDEAGTWAPRMAVYVKSRGLMGRAYMAAISPFRHFIVYPAMMRAVGRGWPGYVERLGLPAPISG